jgi:hypothetical protein
MRLALLFILLFSILGGSASGSQNAFSAQLSHHSVKQSVSKHIAGGPGYVWAIKSDTITGFFIVDDDMEEDEDKGILSFRKSKMPASTTFAFSHLITLSRLHGYHVVAAPVHSITSPRYITQSNFRV